MSDSLSWRDGGSGDGAFAGAVWRPPPGKRGAFLHARLVETGGHGVRVRRLGASRAGEIRLTRFLRNPAVTVEEMAAEAAARTAGRCAGRAVLAIQDTTVVTSEGGGGLYLHAVLAVDEDDGAILGLMHACFLARDAGRRSARGSRPLAEKESRRWLDGAGRARPHRHAPGLARVPSRQTRRRPHCPATQCVNLLAHSGEVARAFVPAAAAARGVDRKSIRDPPRGAGGLVRARVRADVHGKDEEGRRPARAEPNQTSRAALLVPGLATSALVAAVRRRPPTP